MTAATPSRRDRLVELYHETSDCQRCPLAATRTKVVFGSGNADADLMFVGEAPGAEEDRQGLPFVGRAGALLTELLEGDRNDPGGRLHQQRPHVPASRQPRSAAGRDRVLQPVPRDAVELIQPKVVGTLGNFATKLLTGSRTGITKVRGTPQVHVLGGRAVYLMPLLHPAAALRTPSLVETLREDFAKLPELLATPSPQEVAEAREAGEAVAVGSRGRRRR